MKKTVLITGSSSGFGKETAKLFQRNGWNVAATMRNPEDGQEISQLESVNIYQLDVTNSQSVEQAVNDVIQDFQSIDLLINNAGFAAIGALEAASEKLIRKQMDTNFFGAVAMIKTVLPYMRSQRSGIIINISSVAGRIGIPFGSLYNASKFAIEGLTESLQYELGPLGIRMKLIEPTGYKTDFGSRSMALVGAGNIDNYRAAMDGFMNHAGNQYSEHVNEVPEMILKAATDNSEQLRYLVGEGAEQFIAAKAQLGDIEFKKVIIAQTGI